MIQIIDLYVCEDCDLILLGDGDDHVCIECEKPMTLVSFLNIDKKPNDLQFAATYESRLKELIAAWWRQEATIARLQGQRLPCGHTVMDLEQLESGEVICKGCVK